ncbi:DUF6107 family protein [Agrobacterium tumefaciens]|uniref:Uncharacterized protein n=1 Tax=Agrobacterium tumefaciens TaxID=358 RepID=A0A176WYR7_AGRTU|nr:DUF6107 family protein [Agrobacterium tumefaciens]OAE38320.1 hypothetical protein A7J57_17730 [Agrobacterium tumefaciens]
MSEFANEAGIWAARITGAVAGAGVSLVYLLPKSRREAASRFITGVSCGMIFGGPIGLWIVQQLDIAGALSGREIMVAGSAAASMGAWWGLGVLVRIAERYSTRPRA